MAVARRPWCSACSAATPAPGTPAPEPAPGRFEFTIDRARLAADAYTVVVRGTYACGPMNLDVVGGGGTVDLTVNQGRVFGVGFVPIVVCDGTSRSWRAQVTTFGDRPYRPGAATALASGNVVGERDGELVTQRAEIDGQRIRITRR